jgi:N-sulfoglucosamine sulfohydrolase
MTKQTPTEPTRRGWLTPLLVVLATLATARSAEPAPRWNILFVFADDWGRHAGCYVDLDGRPTLSSTLSSLVFTPNIDRIAREGVRFRHAFVSAPSCTPSRSALFTGRHFFNTGRGAILDTAAWESALPSYPLLLRDAGYHIGRTHKAWAPGTPRDAPFGEARYAYEKAGLEADRFSRNVTRRVEQGASIAEARDAILGQVRENFAAFLAARPAGQPWHYFSGITTTHRTWIRDSGRHLWGLDPDKLRDRLPAFLPDVPDVRGDLTDYLGEVQALDAVIGVLLAQLEATGEIDRTLIVLASDNGMPGFPRAKAELYDHGVAIPLIARVPGGTPDRVVDDFVSTIDLASTFIAIAGLAPPAGADGRSLLPQLLARRGGQIERERDSVITGLEHHGAPYPKRAIRTADFLYICNFAPDRWPMGPPGPEPQTELLRDLALAGGRGDYRRELAVAQKIGFAAMDYSPTTAWLVTHRPEPAWQPVADLAFAKRPAEELYDLRNDPDQQTNLAGQAGHEPTLVSLRNRLLSNLRATRDPRVGPAPCAFDLPPYAPNK